MPDDDNTTQPLWHGRFADAPSAELWEYTLSLPFDQRLAPFDIRGCRSHVAGLGDAGILGATEVDRVLAALDTTESELADGSFVFAETDEDIHTAIERRVTELAGESGARVHTGRSRNDQVATAFRLFCKDAVATVATRVVDLQAVLVARADEVGDVYLPGYTHLQQAQPVLLRHHLLAHFWAFSRDLDRLVDAHRRLDVSTLGAGALAGSSLPLDPAANASRLGFAGTFANSLDAVSDRDFVAEILFDFTMTAIHLSRIGEEIVIWSTEEFGFVRLSDAYSTGSSMLPQKKNPDIAELARGKAGRVIGDLTGLLATLKGLPLAYNRDLQEDKEPLFDAFDQVRRGLGAVAGMIDTLTFAIDAMADAADSPYAAATDLAEYLVRGGLPFREAHAVVGSIVRRSMDEGLDMERLVVAEPSLGPEAAALLRPGVSVRQRTSPGGAGPAAVAVQLDLAGRRLRADRQRASALTR
jgi:argininosuccinate lyase